MPHIITILLSILLASSAAVGGTMQTTHSRHYTIHSDLPVAHVDQIAREMDAVYDEYARRLANLRPTGEIRRLEVHLFARRADYERFGALPNSAGIFDASRNILAARLEGTGRDEFRRTLQHEAFHQFAHNRIAPGMPPWLDEGLVQVFEDGYWFGGEFRLGRVPPWRLARLQQFMQDRRLIDLGTMLSMTRAQWNARMADSDTAAVQYLQAWAMAHMLIFATEGTPGPHYRPHLIDLLKRLNRGIGGDQAFRQAFSDNIDGFQQRFVVYLRGLRADTTSIYLDKQRRLARMVVWLRQLDRRHTTMDDLRQDLALLDSSNLEPMTFINGQAMPTSALHFARNPTGPIPDIVCRPGEGFQIRTRFHPMPGDETDFELLVEPVR